MSKQERETILEFPCEFPIKIMGKNHQELEICVMTIFNKHVPDLVEGAIKSRESRNGNYLSITVTINAQSQSQLDGIYQELSAHELVLMAL